MAKRTSLYPPTIFNIFKPAGITSYDVVRHFKRSLPKGHGKIGHFGTLDPFASGVLLIAICGAAKLNNYVHDLLPKTYLAIGKLGVHTETGDLTVEPERLDETPYFKNEIAGFSSEFIEERIREKFLGEYMQSPHKYSAAKFEGKPMHKWAREGVDIKKEMVRREVYDIEVVRYSFPYLSIRFKVSSGTYIRSLFQECAEYLGTHGALQGLLRESIGDVSYKDALKRAKWPIRENDWSILENGMPMDQLLSVAKIVLDEATTNKYINGIPFEYSGDLDPTGYYWVYGPDQLLLGFGRLNNNKISAEFNLPH